LATGEGRGFRVALGAGFVLGLVVLAEGVLTYRYVADELVVDHLKAEAGRLLSLLEVRAQDLDPGKTKAVVVAPCGPCPAEQSAPFSVSAFTQRGGKWMVQSIWILISILRRCTPRSGHGCSPEWQCVGSRLSAAEPSGKCDRVSHALGRAQPLHPCLLPRLQAPKVAHELALELQAVAASGREP
jgi:hypothetical protein